MNHLHIYAKSFGKKSCFYIELSKDRYLAGQVQGSEMEAVLSGLMSIFTLIGPENCFLYFHIDQTHLLADFKSYEDEQNHFISQIETKPYAKAFKKYHELTCRFSFLMSYHLDNSKDKITDRLKAYVEKMIERQTTRKAE